jgi:HAD superfamily hydrolase (TIGR01459 family)
MDARVTRLLSGLASFAEGYDVILCDVWGVIHNGLKAFQRPAEALSRFRANGGKVVLITNSPNPSRIVEAQLDRLRFPRTAYDAIVSSGDVTVSLLIERAGGGMFRIGPSEETALFEEVLALLGEALRQVPLKQAQFVLCTGLVDPWRETPEDYDAILAAMHARRLEMICANPDIVVEDGGELARGPDKRPIGHARVLVIGDAMHTDIKGARNQGFDSLFVTSGIHRAELHGDAQDAALDAAALRQFVDASDFAPTAALAELAW